MNLAVIAIVVFTISSCSKTQFQPANLVGTWSMTTSLEEGKNTETFEDDPTEDNETLSTEFSYNLQYVKGGNATGSGTQTIIYDATGNDKKEVSLFTYGSGKLYLDKTSYFNDNTTVNELTTLENTIKKEMTIEFSKNKTFTYTIVTIQESNSAINDVSGTETSKDLSTVTETYKGSWAFIGADKNVGSKNKERIGLWVSSTAKISKDAYTYKFVSTDPNEPDENYTYDTESIGSNVQTNSEPDMVWEMIEGDGKTMKVLYGFDNSYNSTSTEKYSNGTTTNTMTTISKNTESSMNTVSFSKK